MDASEVAQIRASIESWLDIHEDQFQLDLSDKIIKVNQHDGILFTSDESQVSVTLAFEDQDLSRYSSIDDLRAAFCFFAIHRLVIPGLRGVPSPWTIYAQTPVSSLFHGVTLEDYNPITQILDLSIQTEFCTLYGYLPQKIQVANRPPPQDSYLKVQRDMQGDIKLRVKLLFD